MPARRAYAFARQHEELDRQLYPGSPQYELSTNYHQVNINNYGSSDPNLLTNLNRFAVLLQCCEFVVSGTKSRGAEPRGVIAQLGKLTVTVLPIGGLAKEAWSFWQNGGVVW